MEAAFQQELEDAEFIPMPDDIDQPIPDQLLSVSSSITLPYDELKELKAAAAAASETGLSVNVSSQAETFFCSFLIFNL